MSYKEKDDKYNKKYKKNDSKSEKKKEIKKFPPSVLNNIKINVFYK